MTPPLLNNRYQVIQTLGAGGFGTTFLAEDIQMPSRRKCVIKQLKPIANNPEIHKLVQDRFQREAAILEELGDGSSQIPRLYAYFAEAGEFYLIQEWIEGVTLRDKVQTEGALKEEVVKQILLDILPVLTYVHEKRIVHRDIKPDNIILRKRDGKPVLIDFGAVRETMGTVVNSQGGSVSSIVIGTPGFMPSEQAAGRPMYSSDLYSLGLTMIYLLTARFPQELDLDSQTGEVIWRRYAPSASMDFAAILDKAIQYHPRDRYPTAEMMLAALNASSNAFPDIPILDQTLSQSNVAPTIAVETVVQPSTSPTPSFEVPATIVNPQTANQSNQSTSRQNSSNAFVTDPEPKRSQEVPDEAHGWNWGAFLLPGLWCINNQVWLGLLAWTGTFTGSLSWWAIAGLLGAKGNEWAWKSRRWRDLETFKRNQRNWAIGGFVTWGSFVGLIVAVAIFAPPAPESSTTDSLSGAVSSNSGNQTNEQPTTDVFGTNEPLSEPTTYINGTWRLRYRLGDADRDATLIMQNSTGSLIIKTTPTSGSTESISQTMRLWASSSGLIVLGYNPTDPSTQTAKADYPADNFLFQSQSDGSVAVKICNDMGDCANATAEQLSSTP